MINSKKIFAVSLALIIAAAIFYAVASILRGGTYERRGRAPEKPPEHGFVGYDDMDEYRDPETAAVRIVMNGDSIECSNGSVAVDGDFIYITTAGPYILSGVWNGTVVVSAAGASKVTLYLNNAEIASPDYSAIYVADAEKVTVSTMPDTVNRLSDGAEYKTKKVPDKKANAALYSKQDLTLNGAGTLYVTGNYADAVKTKRTLRIMSGTVNVSAADDGMTGSYSLGMRGGELNISSGGDGIRANDAESGMGYIGLESGSAIIDAGGNGIDAAGELYISDEFKADITSRSSKIKCLTQLTEAPAGMSEKHKGQ